MASKPPVIKAVVNRISGARFDVATSNPYLIDHALKNRDEFYYIYDDDQFATETTLEAPLAGQAVPVAPDGSPSGPTIPLAPGESLEQAPVTAPTAFTQDELLAMKNVSLREILASYDLTSADLESKDGRDNAIALILAAQREG